MLKTLRVLALLAAVLAVESCALDFGGYREGNRDGGSSGGSATGGSGGSSGSTSSGGSAGTDGGNPATGGSSGSAGAGGTGGDHCNPVDVYNTSDPNHAACPNLDTCVPSTSGATHCVKSGGTSYNQYCQSNAACGPDLGCLLSAGSDACVDYCVTDANCTDGNVLQCTGHFSPRLYDGKTEIMYCK